MITSARQARRARKQESLRKQEAARAFAARTGAPLVDVEEFTEKHRSEMDFRRRASSLSVMASHKKEL